MVDSVSRNRVHFTYYPSPPFPVRDVVLLPGLLPILSRSPDFSSRLRDKIWEWPGNEANSCAQQTKVACTCTCSVTIDHDT